MSCLDSVRDLAPEIIVVDTGSTDQTVTIAQAAGARVIEIPWPGNFSKARNRALDAATGRWVLVLDGDEILSPASIGTVKSLVAEPAKQAYELIQRSQLPRGQHLDVAIVRLFPKDPRVRFERSIHEQVNTSLERVGIPIRNSRIVVDHSGYLDPTAMPAKTRRNRDLIAKELEDEPAGDPHLRYFYAATFLDEQEFKRAATEYEACIKQCGSARPSLAATARIQAAHCYHQAGDIESMARLLPSEVSSVLHPLVGIMKGELIKRTLGPQTAQPWFESVLQSPDRTYLPPVVLGPLKLRAIGELADIWASRGRKDVAVKVLHLALAVSQRRISGGVAGLTARYRACCPRPAEMT